MTHFRVIYRSSEKSTANTVDLPVTERLTSHELVIFEIFMQRDTGYDFDCTVLQTYRGSITIC